MNKIRQRILIITLIILCGTSCRFGISSAKDAQEAKEIWTHLKNNFVFPIESKSRPGSPPVFCDPGHQYAPHTIIIYSIINHDKQNEIIDILSKYSASHNLRRSIKVNFFEEENLRESIGEEGKAITVSRGQEKLIRSVNIE